LPATRLKVPDRQGGWRFSNPQGFTAWCRAKDRQTGGDFTRVVMMLKQWRDNVASDQARIRSIVFTTLIGRAVPPWRGAGANSRPDDKVLITTLGRLHQRLAATRGVLVVRNPSLIAENLARDWSRADFQLFREQVKSAFGIAASARMVGRPAIWRQLFGPSFPSSP
jgi:hypothetical protein